MKRIVLFLSLVFALVAMVSCNGEDDYLTLTNSSYTEPIKLDSTKFEMSFCNIKGVIVKDTYINSLGGHPDKEDAYCVKVNGKKYLSKLQPLEWFNDKEYIYLYPRGIKFSDEEVGKKIVFSGDIYLSYLNFVAPFSKYFSPYGYVFVPKD